MKATMPRLSVEATLTLNEKEIAVLEHLAGYDPETLVREVTGRFTAAEVSDVFASLRSELGKVKLAAESARTSLFPR
jgi:hypothetical protein